MDRSGAKHPVIGDKPAAEHTLMLDPPEQVRVGRIGLGHDRRATVVVMGNQHVHLVAGEPVLRASHHRLSERRGWLRSGLTARRLELREVLDHVLLNRRQPRGQLVRSGVALLQLVDQVADREQGDLVLERPQTPTRLALAPPHAGEKRLDRWAQLLDRRLIALANRLGQRANSAGVIGWPPRSGTVMTPVGVSSNAIPPAWACSRSSVSAASCSRSIGSVSSLWRRE